MSVEILHCTAQRLSRIGLSKRVTSLDPEPELSAMFDVCHHRCDHSKKKASMNTYRARLRKICREIWKFLLEMHDFCPSRFELVEKKRQNRVHKVGQVGKVRFFFLSPHRQRHSS